MQKLSALKRKTHACDNSSRSIGFRHWVYSLLSFLVGSGLLSLGNDDVGQLLELVVGSQVGSNLVSAVTDGLLLLMGVASSNHFHHLLLEGGEAGDLTDDVSHNLHSLRDPALLGDGSGLVGSLGGSSDDVSVVGPDEKSTFVVGFTLHVFFILSK